jgi:hypothetical protein
MPNTVHTLINGVDVLIESVDASFDLQSRSPLERSIRSKPLVDVEDVFLKAKDAVFGVAEEFGKEIKKRQNMPDEIELSFAFNFSSEANAWIITCGSNSSIGVTLKWIAKENDNV